MDWESGNQNACLVCAIKIHRACVPGSTEPGDQSDPKVGDGFPHHSLWDKAIRKVREQYDAIHGTHTSVPLSAMGGRKVYVGDCPCGIHFSMCEYHR
jgi:hypothetical protein